MSAVVHVITSLERGGAQLATLEIARHLHEPARPQILITGSRAALDQEAADLLGSRLFRNADLAVPMRPLRDAAAAASLVQTFDRAVRRFGAPIVVHTHSSKAGFLGRLAARAVPGTIVVHTVHGFGVQALGPHRRWLLQAAEQIAAPAANVLVFISAADRLFAESLGLITKKTCAATIRDSIDADRFRQLRIDQHGRVRARARFNIPPDVPLLVTVGNLKPQKDPLFHVDILAAWRKQCPNGQLLFIGDGPLRNATEAHAERLGVRAALKLPGFLDDPRDAYAAADAFLLASAWEGLPRSVLEATAAGLPSVVRDTGWASDVAWARQCTALPRSSPAHEFAAAIQNLLAIPADPSRMSDLPRAFTLAGTLDDHRTLYDALLQGDPSSLETLLG